MPVPDGENRKQNKTGTAAKWRIHSVQPFLFLIEWFIIICRNQKL
ncbi:MAG: hypothetical protein K0R23_516 [Lacrimispora sp.]|jgi:hypothetical protein|nr:hypothetical protein [Lacrimispora sp.]